MSVDFSKFSSLPWLEKRTIFLTKHGSHAYGTSLPTSDLDIKGVAIPTREYFLGFNKQFEQAEGHDPDLVIYDLRKFMKLAADCNPNIIEMLWTDKADWLRITPAGQRLLEARSLFLSQKAKHTFSGYAVAQLKRINTHYRWLKSPPTAVFEGEANYLTRRKEWEQYLNWKATRNPARAELEARFGYDTKHAMHLVRLLRMCREILTTGRVIVRRPDRDELLAIRGGAWSYERLVAWAAEEDQALEELVKSSPLPKSPDRNVLDQICAELAEASL